MGFVGGVEGWRGRGGRVEGWAGGVEGGRIDVVEGMPNRTAEHYDTEVNGSKPKPNRTEPQHP